MGCVAVQLGASLVEMKVAIEEDALSGGGFWKSGAIKQCG